MTKDIRLACILILINIVRFMLQYNAYFDDLDKIADMVEGLIGVRPHLYPLPPAAAPTLSPKNTVTAS